MENFKVKNVSQMKAQRCKQMIDSLAAMRFDERKVDVTLVCGDREFHAHKVILESSSPYFTKMFDSGMKEANSNRVKYDSMVPNTLETVLNYIYSGDVSTINSEQEVMDVLAAAHMMELTDLTEFCFKALCDLISKENCVALWKISSVYSGQQLKTDVLEFVLANITDMSAEKLFLDITDGQLKDFLNFAVSQEVCLDRILCVVLKWLAHDLPSRGKFTSEMFACLNPNLFSRPIFKELLRDEKIMSLSPEISNKLKDLAVEVFVFGSGSKSRSTIRCVIPKFSKLKTDWLSSPKVIQNLAWRISVRLTGNPGEKRNIGFYVECNYNSKETDWSCKATLVYKLVNQMDVSKHIVKKLADEKVFSSGSSTWGFNKFIKMGVDTSPLMDDFLINDTAIFEVEVTTVMNHGN